MAYVHGIKWDLNKIKEEALKYNRRIDFQKKSPNAYTAAFNRKIVDEVCSHMPIIRVKGRTKEECHAVALRYTVKQEFKLKEHAVSLYAFRRGWLDEICSHMKQNTHWKNRKEEVHKVALKYKHRGEFCEKDERYYEVARKNDWLDEVCSHMTPVGHKFKRLVYSYEFSDNTVYVGLTFNDNKRSLSHNTSITSPVFRHKEKTGLTPTKKILSDGYIHSNDAKLLEHNSIEKYKNDGWSVLNVAKAGGLGGNNLIWTDKKIKETVSKYTHLSDLRKNEPNLVTTLYRKNAYREYVKELIDDCISNWDEESVIELISNYTYLKDFRENHSGAYNWIHSNSKTHLIDGLINGNVSRYVTNQWNNKEEALKESLKYKTISELEKNNGTLYRAAEQHGWLDEIKTNMIPKFLWTRDKVIEIVNNYTSYSQFRKENRYAYDAVKKYGWEDIVEHLTRTDRLWTLETAIEEAKKYENRDAFLTNSAGAYRFLKRNGLLDEHTKHMELRNVKGYKEQLYTCSVCGQQVGGIGNLKRWHEDNCKPNRPHSKKK